MKTLELNQMENIEGGGCTDSEMMSAGAGMLVLAAFSFGTLAIAYGLLMAGGCMMKDSQSAAYFPESVADFPG